MTKLERIKKYCDQAKKHNEWEYLEAQSRTDLPRVVEALEEVLGWIKECMSDEQYAWYEDKINSILKGEK